MFSRRTAWKLTPNRFSEVQRELREAGREVLDLTVSNPTRAGVLYDAQSILASLSRSEAMDYDPQPKGLAGARDAVAAYYREQSGGLGIDPESVVLTTSTSEGYSYVFRLLCNAGDEVLVPKPSYPLFEFLADLDELVGLVRDSAVDLTAKIPHGDWRTYLRQILLMADHNAYHLGQIVQARKLLGDWRA